MFEFGRKTTVRTKQGRIFQKGRVSRELCSCKCEASRVSWGKEPLPCPTLTHIHLQIPRKCHLHWEAFLEYPPRMSSWGGLLVSSPSLEFSGHTDSVWHIQFFSGRAALPWGACRRLLFPPQDEYLGHLKSQGKG